MTGYNWSHDSAIWQIENGDPRTARTQSAFAYLYHVSENNSLAASLVQAIARMHGKDTA
jgi:hypothetical protein